MSLKLRVFGLASVGLVLATGAFFAVGSLNSGQAAGSINIAATDDAVVTATTTFSVPQRTFTLDPVTSRRSTTVTATGTGFPSSNPGATGSFTMKIDYPGSQVADVVPDSSGDFETTFKVPVSAVIPSSNTVIATVVGKTATSTTTHSVPSASISLTPTEGPPVPA